MLPERILTFYLKHATRNLSRLETSNGASLPPPQPGRRYLLYAHVPFCESLCPYCSFNRFVFQEKLARQYFQTLRREMEIVARMGYRFSSMYIGGGTPTILIDELCETIDLARSLFGVSEVSCETNPNHLEDGIVAKLEGRVQRLSVGVQSFDDNLLKKIQRYDRFGSGEEILARIQEYAPTFQSFNVDMIFNFPGQTSAMLHRDTAMVIRSGANQTTFYPLMTSPTVNSHLRQDAHLVPAWQEAEFYFLLAHQLAPIYTPASAWAFSRHPDGAPIVPNTTSASSPLAARAGKCQGLIDEYIVDYDDYVGVGSGAFGYLNGSLYVNTFSLKEYRELVSLGRSSLTAHRQYQRREQMRYFYMMRLFGLHLDKRQFCEVFGVPVERGLWIETLFMRFFRAYEQDDNHKLTLTPVGRYLMVVMMREFFNSVNYLREQARRQLPPDERALVP